MPSKSTSQTVTADAARRRTRRGAATRQALIGGAIRCLHALGYAGTSIEAVMEETGISRGSVLNQFPTRIALMTAAIETAMQAMVEHTRKRGGEIEDPVQRVRQMCDVFWEAQNIPEAATVTEVLLAARWDGALAEALRPVARRIETEIDQYTTELVLAAGVNETHLDLCRLHARILILSLRGITLELMYDKERSIIHRALDRIREMHLTQCDQVLPAVR
ncbi:MAG: TetR/AcrR family transcriptional regulator [Hyphomonas sp.]|uniref:TetR/AcrR family transcriptional regulator n=1 Tax=Hyphomonas sp. TaxID=87 RepID=UPI00181FC1C7|nr:TetR/AcrR family transcriptional regulator [Hyphomonas sp.]MBU3921166.1 TetR/AcrR family transcriptional regulator [Alphaproteobacteria bacterium]MBA3067355.1 TetR/AcrR family transcriptional regulator [Hyphomonas sp.]MBU4063044.1 TetR/AcrR family transcriptional regulator [Alphaproteobacteria bacterium]MBU4163625.1 TetR/AcrR family transcriptional regulator [Alphaproteobacteria bacterium]MBU4568634.1 TetR/AcrR family transcriptional regulator [Alphaproteobacteria bacterium]